LKCVDGEGLGGSFSKVEGFMGIFPHGGWGWRRWMGGEIEVGGWEIGERGVGEGRKGGKGGRKEEGRKGGREEGRKGGREEGRKGGKREGGREDPRKEGKKERKKKQLGIVMKGKERGRERSGGAKWREGKSEWFLRFSFLIISSNRSPHPHQAPKKTTSP